jgi:peptidoglycan hydrolase-like amidase
VVYGETLPDQPLRFWNDGGSLVVRNDSNNQVVFFGADTVMLEPKQAWDPIYIDQKALAYRGSLRVGLREGGNLQVVNFVSSDEYMRGALPGEMPSHWSSKRSARRRSPLARMRPGGNRRRATAPGTFATTRRISATAD